MSWLIDNPNIWYVLVGMVGLGFATSWWLYRRPKALLGVAAALGIIALIWLLTKVVVTDRRQLEQNIHALADAAVEGKTDVLLKHLAKDFAFQGRKREVLAESVTRATKQYKVYDIHISSFEIEELTATTARIYFRASVHSRQDDGPHLVACRGLFIKENGQWQLKETRFYNPLVNQNQEITLPLP